MPKTDRASGKTKGKSKSSKATTVQPPDERQVDDPTTAATDAVGDTREEVVSEDQPAEKALNKTGPVATESGAGEGATSKATDSGKERGPILGGKRRAVKVKDKNSGTLYDSKSKAGKALAAEFGLDPNDGFVWYRIVKLSPDRFEEDQRLG